MTMGNKNNDDNIPNIYNIIAVAENAKIEKPKREFIKGEKILLLIAFITAVLCDRLFINAAMNFSLNLNLIYFTAVFEICFIFLFCVFNWRKIYKKPLLWVVAGLVLSLCVWNFIFDYASSYGVLTFFVIPATLMMFTQLAAENFDLKNAVGMFQMWFLGWIIKPFVAIHKCIGILSTVFFPKNGPLKKILAAVLITAPLVALLIFLLSGADKVFGYYANQIFASFDMADFILHGFLVAVVFLLFYSFFWHSRYGVYSKSENSGNRIKAAYKTDNLISYIILGTVLILYILFCTVQFAYLFASAGLPAGISYSDYAREGFAQIVVISGINLIIFGCMLKFGKIHKPGEKDIALKIMLYALVAATGIMLASGFMRLGLYIDKEGMTFLRLISAWFMIYLALVLILCVARLIKEKVPLIVCCAVLLLVSYNVLGYINPDSFIVKYNLELYTQYEYNDRIDDWVDYTFHNLSDDALNILLDNGLDKDKYAEILAERYNVSVDKHSLASAKLRSILKEFGKD